TSMPVFLVNGSNHAPRIAFSQVPPQVAYTIFFACARAASGNAAPAAAASNRRQKSRREFTVVMMIPPRRGRRRHLALVAIGKVGSVRRRPCGRYCHSPRDVCKEFGSMRIVILVKGERTVVDRRRTFVRRERIVVD